MDLKPREIVAALDRYIVGQEAAKRALAIALRNRIRRFHLSPEQRAEINPKNIMMIGPTGVGKTELARRLALLVAAPFVKVEATKFTEVGYVGRDVESMIRELVDHAIHTIKLEKAKEVDAKAHERVDERIVASMLPKPQVKHPLEGLFGMTSPSSTEKQEQEDRAHIPVKADLLRRLRSGELEDVIIEIEMTERSNSIFDIFANSGAGDLAMGMQDMLANILPAKKKRRRLPVREARNLLLQEEVENLLDGEQIANLAIKRAEELGIVFIDEIDKIAGNDGHGPDVSREGVQRDILPIVEGSMVQTKHGAVRTEHILFVAAGAFHMSKPSDLIPELQGRFPIRVELSSLSEADLERILTEPKNALLLQYQNLMSTEGVDLQFTPCAVSEIARVAYAVNSKAGDIGARRLHTILEQVMEEIAFDPPAESNAVVIIDQEYVKTRLKDILVDEDLSRYIL